MNADDERGDVVRDETSASCGMEHENGVPMRCCRHGVRDGGDELQMVISKRMWVR